MKISNAKIVSTDLTNNTIKISFTISEATENVDIYLKVNNEEFKAIFFNKTNGYLEYTVNVPRGVNNLLLKATDSTIEYVTEPIQALLKEAPSIKNLKCSYSDSTGKYILNFAFNGDVNFKYNIYLKLDTNDYIEVLSNQISGDKTIEQTSTRGEHTCILKVSDGYNDYTFSPFQFEITNHKPILSKILVTDITNNGEAYIYYSTKDIESSTLTHRLIIGNTGKVITPTQVDNFYSYKVTGLPKGTSYCMISISDGIDTVSSDVFTIDVFSDTTDKKELLRRAKIRYDSAYQQLRDIIVSVISDLKYDYDIENALIAKAQDNYKIEYSNFNKISQQSIDTIGSNKITVTKNELQSEINDVDNAVNSLETTMWGVFQDGILDQSERDTLKSSLDLVAKEKSDIDKDYEALYNNEDLIDPSKTNLQTSYNNFCTVHIALVNAINNLVNKETIIDNEDKANLQTAFDNWRNGLGAYRTASLEAIDAIAKKKADDSADVVDKKWAEIILDPDTGIQAQVGNLSTTVDGFDQRITNVEVTADGINSTVSSIESSVNGLNQRVTNVEVTTNGVSSTVSSMQSSVNGLNNSINGLDNRVTNAESNITQLANKITSTVMTESDVKSIIEQSPYEIRVGFNDISDSVVISSSGLTVNQGAIACDILTVPDGHHPIIKLFPTVDSSNNSGYCSIDGTLQYEQGQGTAIRLKWDNMNYVRVAKSSVSFYLEPRENFTAFVFQSDYGIYDGSDYESRISTPYGTLCFRGNNDPGLFYYTSSANCDRKLLTTYDISHSATYDSLSHVASSRAVKLAYDKANHSHPYASSSHSHSGYASSSHTHSGYVPTNSSTYFESGSHDPYSNNSYNLGWSSYRWQQVVAKNVYADYCSGSDLSIKENVRYIKPTNASLFSTDAESEEILNPNSDNDINLGVSGADLYEFVKTDLKLCEYNYNNDYIRNGETGEIIKTNFDNKIGFIAQDLQDSYVGQLIVGEWEGQLSYNLNNYVSVLGGALQYDIAYRDEQITILEDRITELENRIVELENKLNK